MIWILSKASQKLNRVNLEIIRNVRSNRGQRRADVWNAAGHLSLPIGGLRGNEVIIVPSMRVLESVTKRRGRKLREIREELTVIVKGLRDSEGVPEWDVGRLKRQLTAWAETESVRGEDER